MHLLPHSPRLTAHQIHEWNYENLRLPETDVRMIQIDGPRMRVYIKLHTSERTQSVLQTTNGQMDSHHETDKLSKVQIELAGTGIRRIRIANLPPEVLNRKICDSLSP